MMQTTLFNYFNCNGSTKKTVNRVHSFKQTNLTDYYKVKPKKKNLILDYFKPKERGKEEEKKVFDLILVDIKNTASSFDIEYIKKNMYDSDLKYIAISYRWGEMNEQLAATPDYTAHITSFDLMHLQRLCIYIRHDPDLKKIRYLWIDAISIDQQHHSRKKETILKMNQIYKKATFILAVPDLHMGYLKNNIANQELIDLIGYHGKTIYKEIFNNKHSFTHPKRDIKNSITNSTQQTNNDYHSVIQKLISKKLIKENDELKIENKEIVMEVKEKELKKAYQFLAYLINDWSNRAWVISEYHIAKEKYINHGTPLKIMFISLLRKFKPFISYYFDDDDQKQRFETDNGNYDNIIKKLDYKEVYDSRTFNQFVKERFMQRSHLDMILNSNATRNEDRFNAILPSWDKYNHHIKNKYTISEWNITDMTSVILKLYEMMDDLWGKATLLYACSKDYTKSIILPSFASQYSKDDLCLVEQDNFNKAYERYEKSLLYNIKFQEDDEVDRIKQLLNEYKMKSKPIWIENLTSIQLVNHHCLSIKPNAYFIKEVVDESDNDNYLLSYSFLGNDGDRLRYVYIPYFTFEVPDYTDVPPRFCTGIYLVGNIDKNKWILTDDSKYGYISKHFCSDDYTFNIY